MVPLHFFLFPYCIPWEEVTRIRPYLRCGESRSNSLREVYLHNYWQSPAWETNLFPTYSFVILFASVWTHEYLPYTLVYNLVLLYLLLRLFQFWSFQLVPVSLWHIPNIVGIYMYGCVCFVSFNALLLPGSAEQLCLILYRPFPRTRISHFSKEFHSFLLKNGFRQKLRWVWGVLIPSWGVVTSRPSQMAEQWNKYVYTNLCIYIYQHINFYE